MNRQQTQLEKQIIRKINSSPLKRLTFYEFMDLALYEKELGYYTKNKGKIGKNSDFYTSTSVNSIFGRIIAKSFIELFAEIGNNNRDGIFLLEVGGGDGRLAADILDEYRNNNQEIYHNLTYYMLEISPYHRLAQAERLQEHLEHVQWVSGFSELPKGFQGIIFSNELLDAFPVHRVVHKHGELKELYVAYDEETQSFQEISDELSNPRLGAYFLEQGITLKEGQLAEVNLAAIDWLNSAAVALDKGYILTIDYGYPASELYASHRHLGTLMCYHQHLANDNPYQNIGDQDITAHVNFSILEDVGRKLSLEKVWFTTQSTFLINNGILNYLEDIALSDPATTDFINSQAFKLNRAIRQLINPSEMGETFKVLLQQKGIKRQSYKFFQNVWEKYEGKI